MSAKKLAASLVVLTCVLSANASDRKGEAWSEVVSVDELQWGYLNPARGSKGPAAADLWGDRTQDTASGILLKFPQGFESPPHIHNVTYRGVVILGALHNDDPAANKTWMPTGSFWVQPAGGVHITAANGDENIAFIEIDRGPYRVQPTTDAFDAGQAPVNVDVSNIAWSSLSKANTADDTGAEIAHLWGEHAAGEPSGVMLKLPAGFRGEILATGEKWRAVVIQGSPSYQGEIGPQDLPPGSYFGSSAEFRHRLAANKEEPVTLYVSSNGLLQVRSSQ